MSTLDSIRDLFPITRQCFVNSNGTTHTITYLDHGASTHPPTVVLDSYRDFLERYYANIHRGNHYLSQRASDLYDSVAGVVMDFIGGDASRNSVLFSGNTTSALDMASFLMQEKEGATLVSSMEHHSNDLPHRRRGPVLRIEVLDDGTLDYDDLETKLRNNRVKLVAITAASNVTGYMPDLKRIARLAHRFGAKVLVDAAQILAHHTIEIGGNDADDHIDMLAAAGHKAYAPFGTAFLIAPNDLLAGSEPYIPGGGTVKFVTDQTIVWAEGVDRHTGGTPNIPGVIALGEALKWLSSVGMDWVRAHELELLKGFENRLRAIPGVTMLGDIAPEKKLGVMPFNIEGVHHDTVSAILNNEYGIATRNGCFCAHPYLTRLLSCTDAEAVRSKVEAGEDVVLPGAVRATIGIYNNEEDLEKLVRAVAELAAQAQGGSLVDESVAKVICRETL
ncbi:MAG: aminotransferase class V-fold PLP-dependent enzyme [Bacteroidetes bacterium]|nr:aminotransferase class V-fold PLP-dependent enzyme [Bacteroidota bacterium]